MTQQSHYSACTLSKTITEKDTCIPCSLQHQQLSSSSSRTWNQPRCPLTNEWIKKIWYIYTMEYYSAINRNSSEPVQMRQINLELKFIKSKVSQKEKSKQYILMHIYGMQKDGPGEPISRAAMEMQIQKTDLWTHWRKEGGTN